MRFVLVFLFLSLFLGAKAQTYLTDNQPYNAFQTDSLRTYDALQPSSGSTVNPGVFENFQQSLKLQTKHKFWNYLFNKPFWHRKGENFELNAYPLLWIEAGKSNRDARMLFINTRGAGIEGKLGKHVRFGTQVFENQARFPAFLDSIIASKHTGQGFPGIIPGFGIAKNYKNGIYDFPVGRAFVEYKPSGIFTFRIAHGNPHIGYGKRSLLLGNHLPPFPYFMVEAKFWHVRYSTFWGELQDVRAGVMPRSYYYKKYIAVHYLDWAILPRWNLGLFEAVVWDPGLGRGFDVNFINPVIFFKTAEFQSGTKSANTLLGINTRVKLPFHLKFYAQFLLDEMTVSKFFGDAGYWGNKFALQTGLRFDLYKNHNLWHALIEYNTVRPYTYSHHLTTINYAHDNWPLAHPWGANLWEFLAEASWQRKRWRASAVLSYGKQGLDFPGNPASFGADVYRDYEDRISNENIHTLQGNLYKRIYLSLETSWMINPVYRLEIFGGIRHFNRQTQETIPPYYSAQTTWTFFGIRTRLFRYHFNL